MYYDKSVCMAWSLPNSDFKTLFCSPWASLRPDRRRGPIKPERVPSWRGAVRVPTPSRANAKKDAYFAGSEISARLRYLRKKLIRAITARMEEERDTTQRGYWNRMRVWLDERYVALAEQRATPTLPYTLGGLQLCRRDGDSAEDTR